MTSINTDLFITGNQEYSARQAGITAGIILAVMVPLVLLIVYVAYKFVQSKRARDNELLDSHQARITHKDDDEFDPALPSPKETNVD